jgi:hypothetical protein
MNMPDGALPLPEQRLTFHPFAELFPLLEGERFDALVDSIKRNGLREPIVLHEGRILDGRNRFRACEIADVKPRTVKFKGGDPTRASGPCWRSAWRT